MKSDKSAKAGNRNLEPSLRKVTVSWTAFRLARPALSGGCAFKRHRCIQQALKRAVWMWRGRFWKQSHLTNL